MSPDQPLAADLNGPSVMHLPLSGRHILVVEDEYLIAEDITAILEEAGAHVIGPANSLPEGMRLAGNTGRIDAAVLNIDLGGVKVFPLAEALIDRGVSFLFLTGYGEAQIPDRYSAIPCCRKPTGPACVLDEMKALLRPVAA